MPGTGSWSMRCGGLQRVGIPGLLDKSLSVLHEILEAEALQLANRGNVRGTVCGLLSDRRRQDREPVSLGSVCRRLSAGGVSLRTTVY
jgi:hypothetical protein